LGQQQWEAVHDRRARGQSISAISRELELDRKTVCDCLRQASWQPYRRAEAASVLDAHRQWLTERAPEVNYSTTRRASDGRSNFLFHRSLLGVDGWGKFDDHDGGADEILDYLEGSSCIHTRIGFELCGSTSNWANESP
jgi:hypothetical protein